MKMRIVSTMGASLVLLALVWPVQAVEVAVEVENMAPHGGIYLSPIWVGFDGQEFTLSTKGTTSSGLQKLAATGDASTLQQEFRTAAPTGVDGVISASAGSANAPNFAPGASAKHEFTLDPTTDRFMNFAAKVYPSSDGFMASTTPIEIFDTQGKFKGEQIITILGSEVMQAGTASTAATTTSQDKSQSSAATAATVIAQPNLVVPAGSTAAAAVTLTGTSLAGIKFDSVASNYKLPNAVIARITVVPEPATIFLLAGGSLMLLRRHRSMSR